MREDWSGERAERHLRSLELFGMRFGLDRMRRMMTVLGVPQRRFHTLHVVGTNGKSSTTRMIAAILQRHGLRTGAYLSPHLVSYAERVEVEERELSIGEFAASVACAAAAAEQVNKTLVEGDHVTQFELLTAAAFFALAEHEVDVAVIEAGLGGRFDATNVIDSSVTALTNVGLEHTRWLGPTIEHIATEKLAVLREGTALVLGGGMQAEIVALARDVARAQGASVDLAGERPRAGTPDGTLVGFQRANFALAELVAERYLASIGRTLQGDLVVDAARAVVVPGRIEVIAAPPMTLLDGAHNPAAIAALVQALPELMSGRAVTLVMGVLEDKDAAEMLRILLPHCARAFFTAPPSKRALPPATLVSLSHQLGFEGAECEPHPQQALAAARRAAQRDGEHAAVLVTGSVYLVGALLSAARGRLADGEQMASEAARGGGR